MQMTDTKKSENLSYVIAVLDVPENREEELVTLLKSATSALDTTTEHLQQHDSVVTPCRLERVAAHVFVFSYATMEDLRQSVGCLKNREFKLLPLTLAEDGDASPWKWKLFSVSIPTGVQSSIYHNLPSEHRNYCLFLPLKTGDQKKSFLAVLDEQSDVRSVAVSAWLRDVGWLGSEKQVEGLVSEDMLVDALRERETLLATNYPLKKLLAHRGGASIAWPSGFSELETLQLVTAPALQQQYGSSSTLFFDGLTQSYSTGLSPLCMRGYSAGDSPIMGHMDSLGASFEGFLWSNTGEIYATTKNCSRLSLSDLRLSGQQQLSLAQRTPDSALCVDQDYVQYSPPRSLMTSSHEIVVDRPTTVSRILDLIRACSAGEVALSQLPGLYMARYHTPLNSSAFGFPTLKAFILACAELCLAWNYEPPPSKELQRVREALSLDTHTQGYKMGGAPELGGATVSAAVQILQQSNYTTTFGGAPPPPKELLVLERHPTVDAVTKDVLVALVAHWVTIHETNQSPSVPQCVRREFWKLLPHQRVSSIGMPLSLLARTWDANWLHICPLTSIIQRCGVPNLEIFIRSIPAFLVVEQASSYSFYWESPVTIFLKRSVRVPIIPELIPDPTTVAFSAPVDHANGVASVIFFPPPTPPASPVQVPPPPPRWASMTQGRRHTTGHLFLPSRKPSVQTLSRQQLHAMLFELIAVNCEWQALRWEAGEDLVEMREEEAARLKKPVLVTTTTKNGERGDADAVKLLKKELRDSKRKRRTFLREWYRQRATHEQAHDGESNGLTPANHPSLITRKSSTSSSEDNGEDSQFIREITLQLESEANSPILDSQRQEYRNRCIGLFISSIKMEWSKYFEKCYPLIYFMEQFRFKKVKQILTEVPNLILTGDGGFMRVVTVEHAMKLCNPYPPRGVSADGLTLLDSFIAPHVKASRFQCSTYLQHVPQEELKTFTGKTPFIRRLSEANESHHPPSALLKAEVAESKLFPLDSLFSLTAIWEMPLTQAREVMKMMIVDLVRFHCIRQRKNSADQQTKEVKKLTDFVDIEFLSDQQRTALRVCAELGIEPLKLNDLPARWNATFLQFSPMNSFVKKAGFDSPRDAAFTSFIADNLVDDVFLVSTVERVVVLFPATLSFLNDPQYQIPGRLSAGAWMKRQAAAYLDAQPREDQLQKHSHARRSSDVVDRSASSRAHTVTGISSCQVISEL